MINCNFPYKATKIDPVALRTATGVKVSKWLKKWNIPISPNGNNGNGNIPSSRKCNIPNNTAQRVAVLVFVGFFNFIQRGEVK